ncbi:MAG: dTMP kinase [Ignavibacteria bacterium]|nr:MAG: dTMP kinase [Ignavibacteria bacterium]
MCHLFRRFITLPVESSLNFWHDSLILDGSPNPATREGTFGKNAPGRLIVFEGLDGAGKTTQIELLARDLRKKAFPVVITTWNSSRLISKAIKRAKKAKLLTPYLYSTLHAADFMYRLENIIMPALQEGAIVIADRYAYTALARDLSRNVDRRWVESLYALAPTPDLAFYCTASVEETLGRIVDRNGGNPPGYYESGMDVIRQENARHSFR